MDVCDKVGIGVCVGALFIVCGVFGSMFAITMMLVFDLGFVYFCRCLRWCFGGSHLVRRHPSRSHLLECCSCIVVHSMFREST